MIRSLILGPTTNPSIKIHNEKNTILVVNKNTGGTELIQAKEASPYEHIIITNGIAKELLMVISSEKEMTKEETIKTVNRMYIKERG